MEESQEAVISMHALCGLRLTIPIYIDRNGNQEDFARNIKSGGTFSSMYFRAQGEIESLGR